MEVESCGGLVEDKEGGLLPFLSDVVSQLDTLVLTARERRRVLSQLDIPKSYILQRLQSADYRLVLVFREEVDGFAYGHLQRGCSCRDTVRRGCPS